MRFFTRWTQIWLWQSRIGGFSWSPLQVHGWWCRVDEASVRGHMPRITCAAILPNNYCHVEPLVRQKSAKSQRSACAQFCSPLAEETDRFNSLPEEERLCLLCDWGKDWRQRPFHVLWLIIWWFKGYSFFVKCSLFLMSSSGWMIVRNLL